MSTSEQKQEREPTPGDWLTTDDFGMVYALIQDGWHRGEPRMTNRFSASLHVDSRYGTQEELKANALLIRAAKDLLAACEALLEAFQESGFITVERENAVIAQGEAAIAKARGE